jgi:predicted NBD/HSP70 family sugar kinase
VGFKAVRTRQAEPGGETPGRKVGRPRVIESAHASLAQVLTLVRTGRATTRAEIEHAADLSRAAAGDRLAALATLGLIEDGERAPSSGGRAPRTVRLKVDAGALLVATVDRSSIAVGAADLDGRVVMEHHEAADLTQGVEPILDRLTSLFLWLVEEQGGRDAIWGVGLAVPGPVDMQPGRGGGWRAGDVLQDWTEGYLVSELALRCGAPAFVRSVTQMMAMGELKAGDGNRDMLFVKLGRTISAGVVLDGRLHLGSQGAAGLIGHVQTGEIAPAPCRCGSRGCLEALVGSDAIARDGERAARDGRSPYLADVNLRVGAVSSADVAAGAQLGDAYCAEAMVRCGRLIGEAIAPFANLLNPSAIVLAGMFVQPGEAFLAAVREAVYRASHPLVSRDLSIVRSRMGGSSGLVGAAQVVADGLFDPEFLQRWLTLGSPRRLPEVTTLAAAARTRMREGAGAPPPPSGT